MAACPTVSNVGDGLQTTTVIYDGAPSVDMPMREVGAGFEQVSSHPPDSVLFLKASPQPESFKFWYHTAKTHT